MFASENFHFIDQTKVIYDIEKIFLIFILVIGKFIIYNKKLF